jgi:hypothetical protein
MRTLLSLILLAAGLSTAAAADYEEVRDLSLNADGISALEIDAGAGSLLVTGLAGTSTIVVEAIIRIPDQDAEGAREIIESNLVLSLERDEDRAVLEARFEDGSWFSGDSGSIQLEVTVPEALALDIVDGSGSITIRDVTADIAVEDGSGSIDLRQVGGQVTIDDGSGSISAEQVGGDITITDGSGSLKVAGVEGSVIIDDGSGSITVSGVAKDLEILESGSGSLSITDVKGRTNTGN